MGVGNDIALTLLIEASDLASPILAKIATAFGPIGVAAAVAGAAVVGFAAESVKMAGDFQSSITKLYTTAGEAKSNLQMVGDGILGMSASVGTGAQQLVQAMYWIESGGLHGAAALEALRVAAEAAKAENANLDSVSKALAASLNAYAGSGMTAVQVMNTLTAATGQGMMTFEQLSGSLASVLPASAKFGISLADVTAALATMTAQGDPAAQAATHLKQMILALEAPSKIGAAALASVGLTSQQVAAEMKVSLPDALKMITDAVGKKFPESSAAYKQAIKDIAGGNKQMMGFLELTGEHMGTFASDVDKISAAVKAGGNNLMGWADIQKNFNFQVDAAKAGLDALMITIGLKLLPVLTAIVQYGIVPFVNGLTWLVNNGGQIVAFFQGTSLAANALKAVLLYLVAYNMVLFIATIPEMVAGLIAWGTAAWFAAAGMLALDWPIVLIAAGVAALIAVSIYLYQHWTEFRNLVNLLGVGLQNFAHWIGQVFSALGTWAHANVLPFLQELWNWIQTKAIPALQEFWNWLYVNLGAAFSALGTWISGTAIPAIQAFWQWLQKIGVAFDDIGTHLAPLKAPIGNFFSWLGTQAQNVKVLLGDMFSGLGSFTQAAIPVIGNFFSWLGTQAQNATTLVGNIFSAIGTFLEPAKAPIGAFFSWLGTVAIKPATAIGNAFSAIGTFISTIVIPALQSVWGWLQNKVGPVFSALGTFLSATFLPVWQQLTSSATQIGTAFSGIGTAFSNLGATMQYIWQLIQTQLVPVFQSLWSVGQQTNTAFIQIQQVIMAQLWPALQALWSAGQQTNTAFIQMQQVIMTQLAPAFKAIYDAIVPTLPQLKLFGQIIGGFVLLQIGILISTLAGLVVAFAHVLAGIVQVFTGIVQIISGTLQTVIGIITFFIDLVSGNFNKLGTDLGVTWNGISTMAQGFGNVLDGIFQATFGTIINFGVTFINTMIGLFNKLTGQSIPIITALQSGATSQAKTMQTNVNASISTMSTDGISGFTTLSSQGSALLSQLEANGTLSMQTLDSNTAKYWNDIANYVSLAENGFKQAQSLDHNLPRGINNPGNFASGVENFGGGLAYVHQGEVLMNLAPGTSVIPASRVSFNTNSTSGGNIYITAVGSTREQIQQISDALDKKWGRKYRTQYGPVANGGGTL